MFCWNCGNEVEESHLFCTNCGARVRTIGTPPVQTMMPRSQENTEWQIQQLDPGMREQALGQKGTFRVKLLPMILIVIMTIGLFVSSLFAESGSMTIAMLISGISGIVLLIMIYRMDKIEPEPLPLLIKLFLCGAIIVPFWVIIVEEIVGLIVNVTSGDFPIINAVMNAFIVAATVEELGKYFALKFGSWNHPAFNFRFDGIIYATTVAIGFEIVENILYVAQDGLGTALIRTAFPGHVVFAIYMGYYYGQAKSHEVNGDKIGAAKLRRKAVIVPLIIHGIYDTLCFFAELNDSDLYVLGSLLVLLITMAVLNVTAYRNIKKYAYEDSHV